MRYFLLLLTLLGECFAAIDRQQPPAASAPPPPKQTTSEADVQAQLNKTAEATIQWNKSTTPGAKAEVQLVEKKQADGRTQIEYRLKTTGAPHNKLYNLIAWPVTMQEPAKIMEGLAI